MQPTRTLTAATFAERYTLPKYRLRVLSGPNAGLEKVFDRRLVYVGSAPDNDLVLDDPSISRNHLKIDGERTGYRVRLETDYCDHDGLSRVLPGSKGHLLDLDPWRLEVLRDG